jgi:hypothetical protein
MHSNLFTFWGHDPVQTCSELSLVSCRNWCTELISSCHLYEVIEMTIHFPRFMHRFRSFIY